MKPTWLNNRDQFLQPNEKFYGKDFALAKSNPCDNLSSLPQETQEFANDCLVWMLFNGSNLTASADNLEWNGKMWSIVNHFIPFTENEVNAPDRFESDFMVQYMADKTFSKEAADVLEEGKIIWKKYFETDFNHVIRNELKLNRPDVGWYQIRQAIKRYNDNGENIPIRFDEFDQAYNELTEKLRPQVYEYGFLKG